MNKQSAIPLRRQGFRPIIKRYASKGPVSWLVMIEDAERSAVVRR